MTKTKYLIIGNSVAAVAAVSGIRQVDADGDITLISRETQHTYSRPLITYLLGGKVGEEQMAYRPADWYEKSGVNTMLGTEVTHVDPEAHTVDTAGGQTIGYEKLLIAVGGTPIVPRDVQGADAEGVFTFTTMDDADAIANYIEEREVRSAIVVGGGLIGLKSVEALIELGISTTVVELADRMLSATFDETASTLAQRRLARAGVEVRTSTTVAELLSENGRVVGAKLTDGETLPCELLIFAIGVLPATGIVQGSGIDSDRGIIVDDGMRTSAEDVYAAGDVAQARALLCGTNRCIAIFPNAYRQGIVAGRNMAGAEAQWEGGLVMNSVTIVDLPTISVGVTEALGEGYEELSQLNEVALSYRKLVLHEGRIVGAVFVGDIDRAGIITGLIRERIDVSEIRDVLMSDDFGLISLPAAYRERVLSGTVNRR
ncbi:MAG: NAD(P)/FAD-dependent oxidoreductase [candidate division WS1 bacterium]|nr:NAD(P)/FAD-dependent oxidoreductase [candidate division WS1 bacterium]